MLKSTKILGVLLVALGAGRGLDCIKVSLAAG